MKLNLYKNKRASLTDPIVGMILLSLLVVTIIVSFYFWGVFSEQIKMQTANHSSNESINKTIAELTQYYTWLDWGIPFFVFGMMLFSFVTSFFSGASFVFAIVSLLLWSVTILMSRVFHDLLSMFSTYFPTVAAQFPIMSFMIENLTMVCLVWLFLISVIIYIKNREQGKPMINSELAKVYGS